MLIDYQLEEHLADGWMDNPDGKVASVVVDDSEPDVEDVKSKKKSKKK